MFVKLSVKLTTDVSAKTLTKGNRQPSARVYLAIRHGKYNQAYDVHWPEYQIQVKCVLAKDTLCILMFDY